MSNEEKILSALDTLVDKVGNLEAGQTRLEAGQEQTNQRLDRLEAGLEQTNQRLDGLEADMSFVKSRVIQIEVVHGKQLTGLFDSYNAVYGICREIRKDVADMKTIMQRQELALTWHDSRLTALERPMEPIKS